MGVFEDLANQKTGMHWQHDRHHSMQLQANPYDPSRDLSPNLPTTSCRGLHELTNVFAAAGAHGHCGCAFKSEFDDDCNGPSDCCTGADGNNRQPQQLQQHPQQLHQQQLLHHVSPPAPVSIGGGGEHEGSSPAQALPRHPLHRGHHPLHGSHDHHPHHHPQQQQPPPHRGYLGHRGSSPEPPAPQPPPPPPSSSPAGVYGGEVAAYLQQQQQQSPLDRGHRTSEPEEPAAAAEVNLCDGCGLKILDRYYLFAVDKRWHATCLQCSRCSRTLATEIKCFYRDGNIYCKSDYQRLYGARRCGRCQTAISPSELVMRARDTVFHVPCFSCAACATVLTKGDQFGMRDNAVFCQHHYRQFASASPSPSSLQHQRSPTPSHQQHHLQQHQRPAAVHSALQHRAQQLESSAPGFFDGPAAAAAPAQPRQKGRPRKRKPKDLDVMAATMDMNSSDSYNMEMAFGPGGLSGSGGPGSGHQRTKRMRTSFKHHQLRTMKSYFHHNHNPDAKDLKQLSQKTGLPKRVLQVWFQNARAKYRRTATKQEGGLGALGPPSIKTEKSCSESSTGSTGIEAVMFHQQQQHYSMPMSPKSYLSSSSPMECGS